MNKQVYSLEKFIEPLENFPHSDISEKLGPTLMLSKSCFEPIFVVDYQNQIIGYVSTFQTLYRDSYPYTTKLSRCLMYPSYVDKNTPLYKVMEIMRDTHVYFLGVFNAKRKTVGVIRAKKIIEFLINDPIVLSYLSDNITLQSVTSIDVHATIKEVQSLFKNIHTSHVVLTNNEGASMGIITRQDIAQAFLQPTTHQRFSHTGNSGMMAYDAEERYRVDQPLRRYMSSALYTEPQTTDTKTLIKNLLKSDYNSVILVDLLQRPLHIISLLDVISVLANIYPLSDPPVVLRKPKTSVPENDLQEVETLIRRFITKFSKKQPVLKIEISFNESKYMSGDIAEYETTLIVETQHKKNFITHVKNGDFLLSIRKAIADIERQEERFVKKNNKINPKEVLLKELAASSYH